MVLQIIYYQFLISLCVTLTKLSNLSFNGFRATDKSIGFTKSDMLFVIQYPMSEYNVEETIEITKMMLEIYKQQKE